MEVKIVKYLLNNDAQAGVIMENDIKEGAIPKRAYDRYSIFFTSKDRLYAEKLEKWIDWHANNVKMI